MKDWRCVKCSAREKGRIILLSAVLSLLFFSCSNKNEITIAEQYGLAYAPLQIMKAKGFLKALEPEKDIRWVKLGNTAAIREAVLAGKADAGFMGIPPFLIGVEKGMNWKLACGLSLCPVGLAAGERVADFEHFTPDNRGIALPQPGSIQHILLAMAAEKTWGDAAYFDKILVTMKHPDGMAALLSGGVDAHFTSPPFLFMETAQGKPFKVILKGRDAFGGDFSFIVTMVTEELARDNPGFVRKLVRALEHSMAFMKEEPEETITILSRIYNLEKSDLREWIYREDMVYTTQIYGLEDFISFMQKHFDLQESISAGEVTLPFAGMAE